MSKLSGVVSVSIKEIIICDNQQKSLKKLWYYLQISKWHKNSDITSEKYDIK